MDYKSILRKLLEIVNKMTGSSGEFRDSIVENISFSGGLEIPEDKVADSIAIIKSQLPGIDLSALTPKEQNFLIKILAKYQNTPLTSIPNKSRDTLIARLVNLQARLEAMQEEEDVKQALLALVSGEVKIYDTSLLGDGYVDDFEEEDKAKKAIEEETVVDENEKIAEWRKAHFVKRYFLLAVLVILPTVLLILGIPGAVIVTAICINLLMRFSRRIMPEIPGASWLGEKWRAFKKRRPKMASFLKVVQFLAGVALSVGAVYVGMTLDALPISFLEPEKVDRYKNVISFGAALFSTGPLLDVMSSMWSKLPGRPAFLKDRARKDVSESSRSLTLLDPQRLSFSSVPAQAEVINVPFESPGSPKNTRRSSMTTNGTLSKVGRLTL